MRRTAVVKLGGKTLQERRVLLVAVGIATSVVILPLFDCSEPWGSTRYLFAQRVDSV